MMEIAHEGDLGAGSGPLVTYRVQCYRHEAFVAEAVNSVLAQTYSPLEILITDDASTDRTFEVIRNTVQAYRGPHRVLLYRSDRNRDIVGHFNDALHLVRGEFFVLLSGDDAAEPRQVERLVAAWQEHGASGVWSNSQVIDGDSRILTLLHGGDHTYTLDLCDYADGRFLDFPYSGACGYPRAVLDRFGPVPDSLGSRGIEHHFGFRAALLGRKHYLPEPLMRRRQHDNRATAGESVRDRAQDPMLVHERQIRVRLQVLMNCRDMVSAPDCPLDEPGCADLARALLAQIENETRRLLEFEAYRSRRTRDSSASGDHSGWQHKPNAMTFVREWPDHQVNIVAAECKYFAVPWTLGAIEPRGLRNHVYPGVVSAWTERELLEILRTSVPDAPPEPSTSRASPAETSTECAAYRSADDTCPDFRAGKDSSEN